MSKPTVAVYKFSSCDGCQLSLLNLEDELLELAGAVEIAYFLEARRRVLPGPYDVGLVEGSITSPHEAEQILDIRSQVRFLVALGTCATAGGIQALRNFTDVNDLVLKVYESPEYLKVLEQATPISQHVKVDLELWGCPVNKYQVLEVVAALLQNRKPYLPGHCVCLDCKRKAQCAWKWQTVFPAWARSPGQAAEQFVLPMGEDATDALARRPMLSTKAMPGC